MTDAVQIHVSLEDLIESERLADAASVLARALPGERVARVSALAGGASGATMLRVETGSGAYVLRMDGPPDGLRDPARQYACQAIAARAGLAPALLYSDVERRVSLSAFVADEGPSMPRQARLEAAATAVRRLHDGPVFPALLPYMDAMALVVGGFTAAALVPDDVGEQISRGFAQLNAAYPRDSADVVAAHCDLNPGNILYAGGRALFVDWESAFAADRYVDVAAVLNYMAADADDEALVLTAYLSRAPDPYEQARVGAMRQINRLFYGTLLLMAAAQQGMRATAADLSVHTYARFRDAPVGVASGKGKIALGCAFLNDALAEMSTDPFKEGLARLRS